MEREVVVVVVVARAVPSYLFCFCERKLRVYFLCNYKAKQSSLRANSIKKETKADQKRGWINN
jgi:hypothetical protein